MFVSQKTPEALLHFNHPTWIQWFTSTFISPSFCPMNPRFFVERMNRGYLNCVTCMIRSPTFISKVELLRLLLKLHYAYNVLPLLKRNLMLLRFVLKSSTSHSMHTSTLQLRLHHLQKLYILVLAIGCVS